MELKGLIVWLASALFGVLDVAIVFLIKSWRTYVRDAKKRDESHSKGITDLKAGMNRRVTFTQMKNELRELEERLQQHIQQQVKNVESHYQDQGKTCDEKFKRIEEKISSEIGHFEKRVDKLEER